MGRARVVQYYNNRYKGSLNEVNCEKLEKIMELDKNGGSFPDLKDLIYNLTNDQVQLIIDEYNTHGEVKTQFEKQRGTLRDDQTLGVAYMYFANNCILGDSVGLGKTAQALGLCNLLRNEYASKDKSFRFLILTEKNLVDQMRREAIKFTGEYIEELYGDKQSCQAFADRYPANISLPFGVVGSHSLLTQGKFIEWLGQAEGIGFSFPFDLIIIDESSILGNSATAIFKNAKAIISLFKRVILLNATPFETKIDTFYSQLSIIDPDLLPTKTNFQKEYVIYDYRGMYPRPTGKYKNQELFRQLVAYRYFA